MRDGSDSDSLVSNPTPESGVKPCENSLRAREQAGWVPSLGSRGGARALHFSLGPIGVEVGVPAGYIDSGCKKMWNWILI